MVILSVRLLHEGAQVKALENHQSDSVNMNKLLILSIMRERFVTGGRGDELQE